MRARYAGSGANAIMRGAEAVETVNRFPRHIVRLLRQSFANVDSRDDENRRLFEEHIQFDDAFTFVGAFASNGTVVA